MTTTVSVGGGVDWTALISGAAVLTALASLYFARRQHRDNLRAQTLPVMSVWLPRLWEDGIEVFLGNVGVGPARGGVVHLWAVVHMGAYPPTVGEMATMKERAKSKADAQVGDIVETFGAIGAGDRSYRPRFLYKDGLQDNSNRYGWLHWRVQSVNAFGEVIPDEGGCPIIAT